MTFSRWKESTTAFPEECNRNYCIWGILDQPPVERHQQGRHIEQKFDKKIIKPDANLKTSREISKQLTKKEHPVLL